MRGKRPEFPRSSETRCLCWLSCVKGVAKEGRDALERYTYELLRAPWGPARDIFWRGLGTGTGVNIREENACKGGLSKHGRGR